MNKYQKKESKEIKRLLKKWSKWEGYTRGYKTTRRYIRLLKYLGRCLNEA